jgi:hypothetical protein
MYRTVIAESGRVERADTRARPEFVTFTISEIRELTAHI